MKTNVVLLGIMAGRRIEDLTELNELVSDNNAVLEFCFAYGCCGPLRIARVDRG